MSKACNELPSDLLNTGDAMYISFWWDDATKDWDMSYIHEFDVTLMNDISSEGPFEWSSRRVTR